MLSAEECGQNSNSSRKGSKKADDYDKLSLNSVPYLIFLSTPLQMADCEVEKAEQMYHPIFDTMAPFVLRFWDK